MEQVIQFEAIIESGIIHIPDQYLWNSPVNMKVTLTPINDTHIKYGNKSEAGALSPDNFSALKLDTKDWKFDREEANERR